MKCLHVNGFLKSTKGLWYLSEESRQHCPALSLMGSIHALFAKLCPNASLAPHVSQLGPPCFLPHTWEQLGSQVTDHHKITQVEVILDLRTPQFQDSNFLFPDGKQIMQIFHKQTQTINKQVNNNKKTLQTMETTYNIFAKEKDFDIFTK